MIEARLDNLASSEPRSEIAVANEAMTDGASAVGEFRSEAVAVTEVGVTSWKVTEARTEAPIFYESTAQVGGSREAGAESAAFTESRTDILTVAAGQHWTEALSELLPLASVGIRDWPEPRAEPIYFAELGEGGEMPTAHSAAEVTFAAANGATATQADASPRTAPATRFRVRLVNTSATYRLYVATSQTEAQTTTAEVIEADFGIWEADLDSNVSVWVRPIEAATAPITVRMRQYATA